MLDPDPCFFAQKDQDPDLYKLTDSTFPSPAEHHLATPWHNALCFDATRGKVIIGHFDMSYDSEHVNTTCFPVMYDGRTWFYVLIGKGKGLETVHLESKISVEMVKPGCGMVISCSDAELGIECIDNDCLTALIKEYGAVVLRGFKKMQNDTEFIDAYSKRASNGMVRWQFGFLHKVKADHHPGFVNSFQALPVHFDLVDPPSYMKIDQNLYEYADFVPREFVLYCRKYESVEEDGATTFIDGNAAALSMNGLLTKTWKNLRLTYQNQVLNGKEAYFGGNDFQHAYPLIMECPWTGRDTLRWCERWLTEDHPDTLQTQDYQVDGADEELSSRKLEQQIRKLAFDDRFFFKHYYNEGDFVFVNNYTTLHGRESFCGSRELWRIQAIPPTDNVPLYFRSQNDE